MVTVTSLATFFRHKFTASIVLITSLCKNQTSWEMKIFNPPFKFCMQLGTPGEMHKNALFKGRSTLVAMVTTAACSRPGTSFSYKNVKKVNCLFLYLMLNKTLQIGKTVPLCRSFDNPKEGHFCPSYWGENNSFPEGPN